MIENINGSGSLWNALRPEAMRARGQNPFETTDKNDDGFIDSGEMQAFADRLEQQAGVTLDTAALINKLDKNADGMLDKEEFRAGKNEFAQLLGTHKPHHTMGKGKPDDFSSLPANLPADETDEQALLNNEDYNSLSSMLLQNYTGGNSGTFNRGPLNILA